MQRALARFLPSFTLCAWSALLFYFYFSGRLNHYLIGSLRWLALATAILLPLVALGLWLAARGAVVTPEDECEPATLGAAAAAGGSEGLKPGQWLALLVLLAPVATAATIQQDSFSSATVRNRGFVSSGALIPREALSFDPKAGALDTPARRAQQQQAAAPVPGAPPPHPPVSANAAPAPGAGTAMTPPRIEPALPTADGSAPPAGSVAAAGPNQGPVSAIENLPKSADGTPIATVVDLLFAVDDPSMRPDFEGRTFEVAGQFLPDRSGSELRFQLVRMFMFCCAADARPVAAAVDAPGSVKGTADMTWLKVVGRVEFPAGADGKRTILIKADCVTPTEPPAEAMLN